MKNALKVTAAMVVGGVVGYAFTLATSTTGGLACTTMTLIGSLIGGYMVIVPIIQEQMKYSHVVKKKTT